MCTIRWSISVRRHRDDTICYTINLLFKIFGVCNPFAIYLSYLIRAEQRTIVAVSQVVGRARYVENDYN